MIFHGSDKLFYYIIFWCWHPLSSCSCWCHFASFQMRVVWFLYSLRLQKVQQLKWVSLEQPWESSVPLALFSTRQDLAKRTELNHCKLCTHPSGADFCIHLNCMRNTFGSGLILLFLTEASKAPFLWNASAFPPFLMLT